LTNRKIADVPSCETCHWPCSSHGWSCTTNWDHRTFVDRNMERWFRHYSVLWKYLNLLVNV